MWHLNSSNYHCFKMLLCVFIYKKCKCTKTEPSFSCTSLRKCPNVLQYRTWPHHRRKRAYTSPCMFTWTHLLGEKLQIHSTPSLTLSLIFYNPSNTHKHTKENSMDSVVLLGTQKWEIILRIIWDYVHIHLENNKILQK